MEQKTKFGELELRIIAGLLTLIIGMIGWFGIKTVDKLEANTNALTKLEIALTAVTIKTENNSKVNESQNDAISENGKTIKNHESRIVILENKKGVNN
jgi:hypothetical protein